MEKIVYDLSIGKPFFAAITYLWNAKRPALAGLRNVSVQLSTPVFLFAPTLRFQRMEFLLR